jgi:hypothetical protein
MYLGSLCRLVKVAGIAVLVTLVLPWFAAESDGDAFIIPGWETEPGFTIYVVSTGFALLALGGSPSFLRRVPWLPGILAAVAFLLTLWIQRRGDLYSATHLLLGAYLAVAVQSLTVVLSLFLSFRVWFGKNA